MDENAIFIDHSTLASFGACHEKARLSFVEHLRPIQEIPALSFGIAIHAGVAALRVTKDLNKSHEAFLDSLRKQNSTLPVDILSMEKRSVERGLTLLSAYEERWRSEVYEIIYGTEGRPFVEIKFRLYLFDWGGRPVIYCGIIDAIARSRVSGYTVIMETKTTGT